MPSVSNRTSPVVVSPESTEGTDGPVFVVGHPRSGTSLLAAMLDRHSQVAVPPETHFFFLGLTARRASARGGYESPMGCDELWNRLPPVLRNLPGAQRVRENLDADGVKPTELLDGLLSSYARTKNARRWAEKSPWHLRCVPQIVASMPDARIVAIVRDGRDCAESCFKAPFHKRSRLWYAATWRYSARLIRSYARRYPSKFHWIRYEDLILRPEPTLREVDRFIGLDFEPRQLDHNVETSSFTTKSEPWKERVNEALDESRVYAWRSGVDARTADSYNLIMGRELVHFGYDEPRLSPAGRMLRIRQRAMAGLLNAMCAAILSVKGALGRL